MTQTNTPALNNASTSDDNMEWQIRLYREGDIPALVALVNAADAIDGLNTARTEEEMRMNLAIPISDPPRQVVLAEGPTLEGVPPGMPLGWGRILSLDDDANGERIYQFWLLAHPAARPYGLEWALAKRLIEIARANEMRLETKPMDKVSVLIGLREERTSTRATLEKIGIPAIRQGWTMQMPLDALQEEPGSVEGVNIRGYRFPDDNKPAHEAYDNSFIDHFEYHPFPEDMWNYMMSAPHMKHELSWLAEVADEPSTIAGFCICEVKEDNKRTGRSEGWIGLLGTVRGWRGKGLGRALLLHGLHSLKNAGVQTALLGVDSESLTGANRLYESVGFRVRDHEILYKCSLNEIHL